MRSRGTTSLFTAFAAAAMAALLPAPGHAKPAAHGNPGAVFTMTNAADGNAVLTFHRDADGTLAQAGVFPTGDLGTGAGLGNQSGLVMDRSGRFLFVVNAGSDSVSVFAVKGAALELVATVPSGGDTPVSVTVHKDLLYVLNAGTPGNISGFEIGPHGGLTPISDSTQPLSAADVGPAQIGFSADGDTLVVTEKATNNIVLYEVGMDGAAGPPAVYASAGTTPFGFAFTKKNVLIVSEANGNPAGGSATSSYRVAGDELTVLSRSVPTGFNANCWIMVTKDGKYAYATNAASAVISVYRIGKDGEIHLVGADGVAAMPGAGTLPLDMALSVNGRFMYTLLGGSGEIVGYRVSPDGSLTEVDRTGGLPGTVNGLAAR